MREELIKEYVQKLASSLGGVRPAIDEAELRELHTAKDVRGMVRAVADSLNLNLSIRITLCDLSDERGGYHYCAKINTYKIPLYGTKEFRRFVPELYLDKVYVNSAPFQTFIATIAHELCHVVLRSIRHELENQEEAVDLAAMVLGYRNFFRHERAWTAIVLPPEEATRFEKIKYWWKKFFPRSWVSGYLSLEEGRFAADLIDRLYADQQKTASQ